MVWIILLIILAFLVGTFAFSYRMLKIQSRKEESVDPSKLRKWDDEDEDDWPRK